MQLAPVIKQAGLCVMSIRVVRYHGMPVKCKGLKKPAVVSQLTSVLQPLGPGHQRI
jgi:hypothetical protein